METSEVKFAKCGDVHIAYQHYGSGPDLVVIPPLISNVELAGEHEVYRRSREYVGRHFRTVEFDKRGVGSSDRFDHAPTLEERIDDILAVLDAEGIERAHLLGVSEGGVMSQLFAAQYPERVDRLILINSYVGMSAVDQYEAYRTTPGPSIAERLARIQGVVDTWGRDPSAFLDAFVPSRRNDAAFARWAARFMRQTASRADIERQLQSVLTLDANDRLADIKAPTLVMNVVGDRLIAVESGRYLADKIPDARFVEIPGADHLAWVMDSWRETHDIWIEFVTGTKPVTTVQRTLATVLFTDIVGSTAQAANVGDAAWRDILDSHDRIGLEVIHRHGGNLIKNMGDGLLATFGTPSGALSCSRDLTGEFEGIGLGIRAGLHAGEVEVREDGDVAGLAVNLAARVMQVARDGSTYVSSTMRDLLLGGESSFTDRGEHKLKGIDGTWRLYELVN